MVLNVPFVSVIVPMRNEDSHIVGCLESILANDYPHDQLEILVIDGMSLDRSREIVKEYAAGHRNIRLLDNRKCIVSSALNIGIQEAKGQIIVRLDAHAVCASDYVRTCVRLLQTTEAVSVGGVQRAVGKDYVSEAIAIALTAPFGVGNAAFRYSERSSWVDTVYLGAWHRSTLEGLGGFDEDWAVNQDYELNVRLRQAGGKLLLSPDIRCWYYVRPTLQGLARQWLRYGFWRAKTLAAHPDSLQWRQLAPPALVAGLVVSLALLPARWPLGVIVPILYASANLFATIWTASRRGWKYLPLLPLVFASIHLSWGAGFLAGLVKWGVPRITLRSLMRAFRTPEAA
jgi:succinoglycan biosynthesis protein ExoA